MYIHARTHYRCESSGRKIGLLQRAVPDNTQHSQQTGSHDPVVFNPTISASERPPFARSPASAYLYTNYCILLSFRLLFAWHSCLPVCHVYNYACFLYSCFQLLYLADFPKFLSLFPPPPDFMFNNYNNKNKKNNFSLKWPACVKCKSY
jgi:hypothetical protein